MSSAHFASPATVDASPAALSPARGRDAAAMPVDIRYVGPLLQPEPVREEAGITIPAYGHFDGKYLTREWQGLQEGFARSGQHVLALHQRLAHLASDSGGSVDHLLRTVDITPSALLWHVQSLGRNMRRRLAIGGMVHGQTQDTLRASIQDTWIPGVTRLRHAVTAIADMRADNCDERYRMWDQVRTTATGRAMAYGMVRSFNGLGFARNEQELQESLVILNHQEVVWSVATAAATKRDAWTERSLLQTINEGMAEGGGRIARCGHHLIGGMIGGYANYAYCRPSQIAYAAADHVLADLRGDRRPTHLRTHAIPDVACAVQQAFGTMIPACAAEPLPSPTLEREHAAWEVVNSSRLADAVDPQSLGWMCEQGFVVRQLPELRGEVRMLEITEAGLARMKVVRRDAAAARREMNVAG